MAPATNVGAAQTVGLSGAVALREGVNDAAEYIVSIAEARGRNAGGPESASATQRASRPRGGDST